MNIPRLGAGGRKGRGQAAGLYPSKGVSKVVHSEGPLATLPTCYVIAKIVQYYF